jgi:hypothetical protein
MGEIERKNGEEKPSRKWVMILIKVLGVAVLILLMVMAYIRKHG